MVAGDELLTFTGNTILFSMRAQSKANSPLFQCLQLALAIGLPALLSKAGDGSP